LLKREADKLAGNKRLREDPGMSLQLQDKEEEDYFSDEGDQLRVIDTGAEKRFKADKIAEEKREVAVVTLPMIESPFAQDADLTEFVGVADFWSKPKKMTAVENKAESDDSYGDEEDSSEDDDAEELMREYEKLKKEREEEKHLKELAEMEEIKRR